MQYRKFGKCGFNVSALGFGIMRMPVIDKDDGRIDEEKSIELIRYAIDNGVNYLDTAYFYHRGGSETLIAKALKDGYRDKVRVATKMPTRKINEYSEFERIFNEQLARLETDSFDFYLLHHVNRDSWDKYYNMGILKFLDKKISEGKIKHVGFSYHDNFELFKEIIDIYGWDFVQIQYNYVDEYNQAGKRGLEYAASKGLGIVVMEPLRGGELAEIPPREVAKIWEKAHIERTPAEWSLRWIWNHPEVSVLLSGMNTIEQIKENIRVAEDSYPDSMLNEELKLVKEAKEQYEKTRKIGCTGCLYCVPCSVWIRVPDIFSIYNKYHIGGDLETYKILYREATKWRSPADCTQCQKCEKRCPQRLPIRELLKEVDKALESSFKVFPLG
jgi:predicted aldo/keto reductase-like oxidoreductase